MFDGSFPAFGMGMMMARLQIEGTSSVLQEGQVDEAQQGILGAGIQLPQVLRAHSICPGSFLELHSPQLVQHLLFGERLKGVVPLTLVDAGACLRIGSYHWAGRPAWSSS